MFILYSLRFNVMLPPSVSSGSETFLELEYESVSWIGFVFSSLKAILPNGSLERVKVRGGGGGGVPVSVGSSNGVEIINSGGSGEALGVDVSESVRVV